MADLEDPEDPAVGAALMGAPVAPKGVQNIMTPAPQPEGGGFLSDPRDRAALLQIGLSMMQPHALGQSFGGHIAQAVGSGGEAVTRYDKADLEEQQAETKLQVANERLKIAQQNANTRAMKGVHGAVKGLTANQEYMHKRYEAQDAEKAAEKADKAALSDAEYKHELAKAASLTNPNNPYVKKGYHEMTPRSIMILERGAGGGGGGPAVGAQRKQNGVTYTWDGKNWN